LPISLRNIKKNLFHVRRINIYNILLTYIFSFLNNFGIKHSLVLTGYLNLTTYKYCNRDRCFK